MCPYFLKFTADIMIATAFPTKVGVFSWVVCAVESGASTEES